MEKENYVLKIKYSMKVTVKCKEKCMPIKPTGYKRLIYTIEFYKTVCTNYSLHSF